MTSVMARKKPAGTDRPADTPTPVGKAKRQISYRPYLDTAAALAAYRGSFEYPPDVSEVIERAMRAFLRGHGFDLPERPPVGEE